MKNILLEKFDTVPFSQINDEDFLPAIKELIKLKKDEIDNIVSNQEKPNFKNTIEALESSGDQLERVTLLFSNLNSAETNDNIQQIAKEIKPLLAELSNDIILNEDLFDRIKIVYDQRSNLKLSPEETTLLNNIYKDFFRNGANLSSSDKKILRTLDKEISLLSLKFNENLLADTNNYEILLKNESDLDGVPEGAKEAASILAKQKGKKGWLITLDIPSFLPFLKYSTNRELRKKIKLAFGSRCFNQNSFNNEDIVLTISKLRYKRATLLGYSSHAEFILEERMAKKPSNVMSFLNELLEKALPFAKKEFKEIEEFAKKIDGIDILEPWDFDYYAEKLRKKLFDLDSESLRPFLKLDNVLNGAFRVAENLFDLNFKEVFNIDVYHKDVRTFEVLNNKNELIALFYLDFHPRAGKRGGAWMTYFKGQKNIDGKNERPHIANVCNFTSPTDIKPSLITFNEMLTLFHEFGHGLHGMLANTKYSSLSGANVLWDFVELPSQILENWCYEKECLETFAQHYQTGEDIPMELIDKIKKSSTFLQGTQTLRQISLGLLDMSWHNCNPSEINNVKKHEESAISKTQLFNRKYDSMCTSVAFAHIFSGGYSSGYYSYKWAEVLDADAFEFFKENGVFSKKIGQSFKDNILSKGGTEEPMVLYKRFRGKEPSINALLKRSGLIEN